MLTACPTTVTGAASSPQAAAAPVARVPALDALRGIAVLTVTLYHLGGTHPGPAASGVILLPGLDAATHGVDLFFVLSGFLITGILYDTKQHDNYLTNFFARRSLRIFPLYYGVLLLVFGVLPWLDVRPTWLVDASTDSGWLFCYGTNLVISARRQWCFGPLDHFWSLAVEEQFYLLWPFVILWLRRRQAMLLCASLIVGASLGRFVWILEGGDEVTRYALTVFRMDTLAAGAWIALYLRGGASVASCGRIATVALCTISLLLLPLSVLHLRLLSLTDVLWTAGCAALLVAMLAAQPGTILDHVGKSRVLGWFGHYSYGLYVFGNLLIAALAPLITAAEMGRLFGNNYVGQVVYVAVVGAATVAVAVLSWHLYEKHFLGLKALLANAAKRRPGIG